MSEMIPGALINRIKAQIQDEANAVAEYDSIATIATNLNYGNIANTLRGIAADEVMHRNSLEQILKRLEFTDRWGERKVYGELHRPFPQIYDDWANLGLDIIEKDNRLRGDVQEHLSTIYLHLPGEDDSKRWLVRKAGELGIT